MNFFAELKRRHIYRVAAAYPVVALFFVAGCATAAKNVGENYRLSQASGKGLALASITLSHLFCGQHRLYYRKTGSGDAGFFHLDDEMRLLQTGSLADLFVAELEAGDYEIYRWSYWCGSGTVSSSMEFSVPFHVSSGKPVYLGSFRFQETWGIGSPRYKFADPLGVDVSRTDEAKRDLKIFSEAYPYLASTGIDSDFGKERSDRNLGGGFKLTYPVDQ